MSKARRRRRPQDVHEDAFKDAVKRELFPMIEQSAVYLGISPDGEPDAKFCVELGAAIMYDKPLIFLVAKDRQMPPGLRRIAHAIVEDVDFDTPEGLEDIRQRIEPVIEQFIDG